MADSIFIKNRGYGKLEFYANCMESNGCNTISWQKKSIKTPIETCQTAPAALATYSLFVYSACSSYSYFSQYVKNMAQYRFCFWLLQLAVNVCSFQIHLLTFVSRDCIRKATNSTVFVRFLWKYKFRSYWACQRTWEKKKNVLNVLISLWTLQFSFSAVKSFDSWNPGIPRY